MKTTRKLAIGLSMLCLIGLIGIGLNLHVCSIEKTLLKSSSDTVCTAHTSSRVADLSVTRILIPIINQYLADFLPRLVH